MSERLRSSIGAERLGVSVCLLIAVAVGGVATFRLFDRSLTNQTYRALAFGNVHDMDPADQPSRGLREEMIQRLSLYLAIGEVGGRQVLVTPDLVPDPQLLFGIGRVKELQDLASAPARAFAGPTDCGSYLEGVDSALGPFVLCLSDATTIEMFRDGGQVVVQDGAR